MKHLIDLRDRKEFGESRRRDDAVDSTPDSSNKKTEKKRLLLETSWQEDWKRMNDEQFLLKRLNRVNGDSSRFKMSEIQKKKTYKFFKRGESKNWKIENERRRRRHRLSWLKFCHFGSSLNVQRNLKCSWVSCVDKFQGYFHAYPIYVDGSYLRVMTSVNA